MIQDHHLEHVLSAFGMHFHCNTLVKLKIRTNRFVNLRAAGPAAALVRVLTLTQ
jgi:hypothetical protein